MVKCPKCGSNLVKRSGKYGDFLGCSNYPDCKHTQSIYDYGVCPTCGGSLRFIKSIHGDFLGCSNYPNCRYTKSGYFEYGKYEDYIDFDCDYQDMRARVNDKEFPDNHPIYLLDINSVAFIISFDDLIREDMDMEDAMSRPCYYGFDEEHFLVVVNAYYRDVGEQPWAGDDISEYLEETYGLKPDYY